MSNPRKQGSTWKGAAKLAEMEQHDSPKRESSKDGEIFTSKFRGDADVLEPFYKALKTGQQKWLIDGAALPVENVALDPEGPGLAVLTVIHKVPYGDDSGAGDNEFPTKRRLVWQFIARDIRMCPLFESVTYAELQAIERALEDHEDPVFAGSQGGSEGQEYEPRWMLFRKLQRGNDTYDIAIPIITLTSFHRTEPASGQDVNKIVKPPAAARPISGYEYRMTGDEVNDEQQAKNIEGKVVRGLFSRTREYTGADKWDRDLYEKFPAAKK